MDIHRVEEFKITVSEKASIHALLAACFPGYPKDRTYHKQLPNFRYLAYQDKKLIGHLAVEHRMISIDKKPFAIFGVADICVAPSFRKQSIASQLLKKLEDLGVEHNIDFVMLTANEHDLFLKNKYQLHSNTCRWLFINEHQTLGVKYQHLSKALMIKPLTQKKWSGSVVDFMGPVF